MIYAMLEWTWVIESFKCDYFHVIFSYFRTSSFLSPHFDALAHTHNSLIINYWQLFNQSICSHFDWLLSLVLFSVVSFCFTELDMNELTKGEKRQASGQAIKVTRHIKNRYEIVECLWIGENQTINFIQLQLIITEGTGKSIVVII